MLLTNTAARSSLLVRSRLAVGASTSSASRSSTNALLKAAHQQKRTMVTKEERWTQDTASKAQQLLASPSGAGSVELKTVLPNIEARWKDLAKEEQYAVFRQLEEVQKKDWKELTLDEKKAAYFISFGPHGPRKPITAPGQAVRTFIGVTGLVGATVGLFYFLRIFFANSNQPRTMNKEYQEAMTERALEQKQNPITGIASEGYKGKGHVQSA